MANQPFQPSWEKHIEKMESEDVDIALKATDNFENERAKETKNSTKARNWENDRRKSMAKIKPAYTKYMGKKQIDKIVKPFKSFKEGGIFAQNIKPMPGYLLLEVDTKPEKTAGGIVVAQQEEPNTGQVQAIGAPMITHVGDTTAIINPEFSVGDRVLFKKYAGSKFGDTGLNLNIKGKEYRLMRWSANPTETDILGVLHD